MIIDNILTFLGKRDWTVSEPTGNFFAVSPPATFKMSGDFRLYIPINTEKKDSANYINNVIEIIGEFYDLTTDDLNALFENESTILKVRLYDKSTYEGKIPLIKFEELVEKIRSILSDTASFVIDRNVSSNRIPDEVNRYLHLCNFLQTEKGSFIAKIQLPSKEVIKDSELFDRETVYSEEINNKLGEVLTFINEDVFNGNIEVSEEYLIENESRINVKLFKDIELFFDKIDIKNIHFDFHNINYSNTIKNDNLSKEKLYKLNQFIEQVESHSFEIGWFSFTGRITALKSYDPDGLKNSITCVGIHNGYSMVATASLNSNDYKHAIEAHKLKQNVIISGEAKRTKTKTRFIEVTAFEMVE